MMSPIGIIDAGYDMDSGYVYAKFITGNSYFRKNKERCSPHCDSKIIVWGHPHLFQVLTVLFYIPSATRFAISTFRSSLALNSSSTLTISG